jgi:hypothetical protein
MVVDESGQGRVYGMDTQDSTIDSTSTFLKMAIDTTRYAFEATAGNIKLLAGLILDYQMWLVSSTPF